MAEALHACPHLRHDDKLIVNFTPDKAPRRFWTTATAPDHPPRICVPTTHLRGWRQRHGRRSISNAAEAHAWRFTNPALGPTPGDRSPPDRWPITSIAVIAEVIGCRRRKVPPLEGLPLGAPPVVARLSPNR